MTIEEKYADRKETHKGRGSVLTTTGHGLPIVVRPIRPEDKQALAKFFKSLSQRSVYLRFFSPIRHFPDQMIQQLCEIDGRYDIVLVALDLFGNMLGKSTICILEDEKHAEFAVLIADEWQGKGIGAELLKRCLMLAKGRGVETVYGRVLSENTKMLTLGEKLGFVKKTTPEGNEYELVIDLKNALEPQKGDTLSANC